MSDRRKAAIYASIACYVIANAAVYLHEHTHSRPIDPHCAGLTADSDQTVPSHDRSRNAHEIHKYHNCADHGGCLICQFATSPQMLVRCVDASIVETPTGQLTSHLFPCLRVSAFEAYASRAPPTLA